MILKPATLMRRASILAEALPRAEMEPAVLRWVGEAPQGRCWHVALSGGVDSVCLLLLLWAHWPERHRFLRVLHYNHGLRGAASSADERFCRRLCEALSISIQAGRRAEGESAQSEAAARALRFAFFQNALRRSTHPVLWLGHQQSDIAESMLMRLSRGSGSGGLAAPRPVRLIPEGGILLRPLLTFHRSRIEAAARMAQIPWREDASNATGDYFRNRIRHEVVPVWGNAARRDAVAGAAWSRKQLDEDDQALNQWAESLWGKSGGSTLALCDFLGVPRAVLRRVLHLWLGKQPTGDLSRHAFEALLDALITGKSTRYSIGKEGFALIRRGQLRFEPADDL